MIRLSFVLMMIVFGLDWEKTIEVMEDLFRAIWFEGFITYWFSKELGILNTLNTLSLWPLSKISFSGDKDKEKQGETVNILIGVYPAINCQIFIVQSKLPDTKPSLFMVNCNEVTYWLCKCSNSSHSLSPGWVLSTFIFPSIYPTASKNVLWAYFSAVHGEVRS